ncbi:hypothetical protein [Sphingobium agri]|uniref:Uncharacterized protein n=1 Tax=Sphingobium agri TaxID=2933566 RepID=A0ABT0E202_9SPHN|nr:hypothetical protein [Sphingobium agri]MCK0533408.1 hypothetical protein [Sphingobium agri]
MTDKTAQKLYAQRDLAIDGKHFKSGQEVKGVSTEQLALSERQGFVAATKPNAKPVADDADQEGGEGGEGEGAGESAKN